MDVNPERHAFQLHHRWLMLGVLMLGVPGALGGCHGPEAERLSCGDVLAPGSVEFPSLLALVRDPEKGCLLGACHTADTQARGLRLDTEGLVFEEMSTRADEVYAVLSSGQMPEGGTPWSDDDLRLFRSWYCSGAFPR